MDTKQSKSANVLVQVFDIALVGPPGSGKTTLLHLLENPHLLTRTHKKKESTQHKELSFNYTSRTGDLWRRFCQENDPMEDTNKTCCTLGTVSKTKGRGSSFTKRRESPNVTFRFYEVPQHSMVSTLQNSSFDALILMYPFSSTVDIHEIYGTTVQEMRRLHVSPKTRKEKPIFFAAHKFDCEQANWTSLEVCLEEARQWHNMCSPFRHYQQQKKRNPYMLTSMYYPETIQALLTKMTQKLNRDKRLELDWASFVATSLPNESTTPVKDTPPVVSHCHEFTSQVA